MENKKVPKSSLKYYCKICNYNTSRESQYKRHLLTAKHERLTDVDANKKVKKVKEISCDCGKVYKYMSSLCKHKKKCNLVLKENQVENSININAEKKNIIEPKEEIDYKELVMQLLQQNSELQKSMKELIPVVGNNNNNNNTINSNNKTFNVQMYLNTECKNALSIQDFIESIELNTSHLKAIGDNGYIDSISNVLITALNKMKLTERPLHCTDAKRETLYIKDLDTWEKGSTETPLIRKAVRVVENKHEGLMKDYITENPKASELDSAEGEFYIQTHMNILGNGVEPEKLTKKIFKKVMPNVKLDKTVVENEKLLE